VLRDVERELLDLEGVTARGRLERDIERLREEAGMICNMKWL